MLTYGFGLFTENSTEFNTIKLYTPLNFSPMTLNSQSPMLTTLISPTGDGGLETGGTFALNNFTVINGTTNTLTVGNLPVVYAGTNCAYSWNGTTWTGNTNANVNHFYRDITFPGGETNVQLKFWYKESAVDASYDQLKVFLVPTTTTPVAGTQLTSGQIGVAYDNATAWTEVTINLLGISGTQRLVFSWKTDAAAPYAAVAVDNIQLTSDAPPPMVYNSSTTTGNTAGLFRGTTNNQVIGIQVTTTGTLSPFTVSQLNLNTNGTTAPLTDITNAKIYYTGLSNSFSTATQFGSTVASPNGAFAISGSQVLASGTNYFWLTYDVPPTATRGNFVDGECASIVGSGTMGTVIPSPVGPPGNRKISNSYTLSESFDNATFPPTGWNATIVTGSSNWARSTAGTSPTCVPHSGAGMALYQSYYGSGSYAILSSLGFDNTNMGSSDTASVSFWMYRDPGQSTYYDSIGVYVNTSQSLIGAIPLGNIRRYNTTASWYQFTYNLPRIYSGSINYIIFKGVGWGGYNMYLDDININCFPSTMSYTSSMTIQNTIPLVVNSTNNQIISIQVATNGSLNPFSITQMKLTTTGSTNAANDLLNAKVFYTGNTSTFNTATQFGTTVTNPNGTFYMTGSQTLTGGTNYFWLTYDITPGANDG